MSSRIAWTLLVVVTAGAAGTIWWEEGERARLRDELGRSRKVQLEMKSELDDLGKRIDGLQAAIEASAASQAAAPGATGASAGAGGAAAGAANAGEGGGKSLFASVMESGLFEQIQGQMVKQELDQMDRAVKLTPREREDLEKVLKERTKLGQEMARKMMSGEKTDPKDSVDTFTNTEAEIERILGKGRYQDYQAAKEKDLAEQKETAFRSQFSFFARDVGLRDEQLPQAETIMRSGGFGMMGSFVPDQATGEWAKDAAADGSASTKTLMAKMVDKRRQQLDATAEQLAGVLDADQLAKFETWRKTQESQLDLMQSFVPDMPVPTAPTPHVEK
ncbi:MAG: hypothetical protein IPK07_15375 [Deltaproteobacteria bacterium]|nr:hypothetical protein [Deltaproteobacteria bacterium]